MVIVSDRGDDAALARIVICGRVVICEKVLLWNHAGRLSVSISLAAMSAVLDLNT